MKTKLNAEGSEVYEKIVRLKMLAEDGKIAKDACIALEQKTGKKVVTGEIFLPPVKLKKNLKEYSKISSQLHGIFGSGKVSTIFIPMPSKRI